MVENRRIAGLTPVSGFIHGTDGFVTVINSNQHAFVKQARAVVYTTTNSALNTWERVVWTVDTDNKARLYVNGALAYTDTDTQAIISQTHGGALGSRLDISGNPFKYFPGNLDEIRISNIARSADWIATEYNNQNSPATFYAISAAATNQPPVANAGGPYSGTIGSSVSFNGSGSSDADGIASYAWNFGDGGTGSGSAPTHAYSAAGTYNVTVTVTDNPGAQANAGATVSISGGGSSSAQIHWLVTDQLGTPRMIFDKTGSLAGTKRHDYLPFGEELYAGIGSRSAALGYGANDGVRQKFTLKERDNETGLDYFLARYYSSTQGRFTSPDEFRGGSRELYVLLSGDSEKQALPYADISDPQSLNKYTYCYNNPLQFVDPDGHLGWPLHFLITYVAGVRTHHGLFHSLKLAFKTANVDFRKGSQDKDAAHTNMHAMRGKKPDDTYQSAAEARTGTAQVVTNAMQSGDTALAGHDVEDAATPGHDGKIWKGMTLKHLLGDIFPSPGTVKQAYENEKAVLQGTNPLAPTPTTPPAQPTTPPAQPPAAQPTPPPKPEPDKKERD